MINRRVASHREKKRRNFEVAEGVYAPTSGVCRRRGPGRHRHIRSRVKIEKANKSRAEGESPKRTDKILTY